MSPSFISLLQRITGFSALGFFVIQMLLGAFMKRWIRRFGKQVFKFHIIQGVIIYLLVLAHFLLSVLLNFKLRGIIDPFYVFTDFCLICPNLMEFYYTLGRISFWLLSLTVLAAVLREETWWKEHWRKFHRLNYVVFLLMTIYLFSIF